MGPHGGMFGIVDFCEMRFGTRHPAYNFTRRDRQEELKDHLAEGVDFRARFFFGWLPFFWGRGPFFPPFHPIARLRGAPLPLRALGAHARDPEPRAGRLDPGDRVARDVHEPAAGVRRGGGQDPQRRGNESVGRMRRQGTAAFTRVPAWSCAVSPLRPQPSFENSGSSARWT